MRSVILVSFFVSVKLASVNESSFVFASDDVACKLSLAMYSFFMSFKAFAVEAFGAFTASNFAIVLR